MPIDTHAAVRKLENGGFETQQAEALVDVINGGAGEQATKDDVRALREDFTGLQQDFKDLREDFKDLKEDFKDLRGDFKDLREEVKEQREDFSAAMKEQREDFSAALKEQREDFSAALKELREDFSNRFATKEDFAKLETRIEATSNKMLLALITVAGLLFAALKLWP